MPRQRREQLAGLARGECAALLAALLRPTGQLGDVADDEAPVNALVEALGEHRADATDRRDRQAGIQLGRHQRVDVRCGQLGARAAAEGGDDVVVGDTLVVARGHRGDLVAQHVVVPASEQLGHGDLGVGRRQAVVDLALEGLQLLEAPDRVLAETVFRSGRPSGP